MKNCYRFFAFLFLASSLFAGEPSSKSIERLLVVTEVEKLLASMRQQVDAVMKGAMDQAFRGKNLSPDAQQYADNFQKKVVDELKAEMSWEKMKDLYVQVYRETFTQEEIDGLITFYESATGKAFVAKMPTLMQKSMSLTQQRMGPMMERMQRSIQEAATELDAKARGVRK